MRTLRSLYRWLRIFIHVLTGVTLALVFMRGVVPTSGFRSRLFNWWLGGISRIFGVQLKVFGKPLQTRTLFVPNHLCWLDITVLGSLVPMHFLAKLEIRSLPVIGWLATRAGTLYIHRGRHESASQAVIEISEALQAERNCLVFAEGRTTDGTLAKFHGRTLQSAIDAHATIQPVAIFYPVTDADTGKIILNPATLFIGDMSIGESLALLLPEARVDVEVHFLEPIECRGRTRDELATHAYDEVSEAIGKIKNQAG